MKGNQYYSTEELKYIALGVLTEKILRNQDKLSKIVELQERLIETDDRSQILNIYKLVVEPGE